MFLVNKIEVPFIFDIIFRRFIQWIDKEYCIGELNYTEKSTEALIPTNDEIVLFVNLLIEELYKKDMSYENCRPSLFIGNLGTVHHSSDGQKSIKTSLSFNWVEAVKKYGFYSAVLHGTTNSKPQILEEASIGCHKINVAGDLLKTYLDSLPVSVDKKYRLFNQESKYKMKNIRELKKSFCQNDILLIKENIYEKAITLFKTINSLNFIA